MLNWHVLYTKPHSERQVLSALQARCIEAYLPALPVPHPRRGRSTWKPFFPCYLFAQVDLAACGLSAVIYTPGLRSLVTFGGEPAIMAEADLAAIRARLAQPHVLDHAGEILEPGDPVEILDPAFSGIEAVFDRCLSAEGRVRVLLRYLQVHAERRKDVEHVVPLELDRELVSKRRDRG